MAFTSALGYTVFYTGIGIVIGIVALYALIWAVLLAMFNIEQRRIFARFDSAFNAGQIKTKVVRHRMAQALQLSWADGNGFQHVRVNEDGEMLTPIQWDDTDRNLTRLKISKAMRTRLQPKLMEVAAMHKLQHGPLSHQNDGDAATTAPF